MSDRIGYSDDSIEQWTHIRRVSREYPSLRFIHAAIVLEFSLVSVMACKKKKKKKNCDGTVPRNRLAFLRGSLLTSRMEGIGTRR